MATRRLNYLLVMPRVVQTIGDGYAFPLGIAYVSSSLKHSGYNVTTLNLNHVEGDVYDILEKNIRGFNIDVVGTGGLSFQYPTIFDVIECAKRIKQNVITIVGGGIITAEPEIALQALQYVDYGIVGEAESTICELAHALESDGDPAKVQGIVYMRGGTIYCTPARQELMALDSLPWPDYEGFELSHYLRLPSASVNNLLAARLVYVSGSRSCPYNCTFCFHSTGKKYRQRSIAAVVDEISFLKERYDIGFVCMTDELFARKLERVSEFCQQMNCLNLSWSGSFRVDDVSQELIDVLKNGRCASMGFGLESADNRILKSMRKHINVEQIESALKKAYDAKIPIAGNFIFGDIEETLETAHNTLAWWTRHAEYNIGLNLISTYPGSFIYEHACGEGIIKDRVQYLKDGCPQINISRLNGSEFGLLAEEIFEAPYRFGKQVEDVSLYRVQPGGRASIVGKCCECRAINAWDDVKLFVGNSWLPCSQCGQKHYLPMPRAFQVELSRALSGIISEHESVAMWGITYYSIHLFKTLEVFMNPRVTFIDNASSKQMMRVNDRAVYPPHAIAEKNVSAVVIFYPNSIRQLSAQIRKLYPCVTAIIDVCDLVGSFEMVSQGTGE